MGTIQAELSIYEAGSRRWVSKHALPGASGTNGAEVLQFGRIVPAHHPRNCLSSFLTSNPNCS